MGWTGIHANYYKNGTVNRKAECDAYFEEGLNQGHFKVVKSCMKGSVYYAAIKTLKTCIGKNEKGEYQYVDIPQSQQEIFAVVFLTSVNMKDYHNFSYKNMDETVGPCYYDCPKSILNILSPTKSKYAQEWRNKCYEQLEKNKQIQVFRKLKEDTKIKVVMPFDTKYYKEGDIVTLIKLKYGKTYKWFVTNNNIYFTNSLMKNLIANYEIIE